MTNELAVLEWDSEFFGYPVGKITASAISSDALSLITRSAGAQGIRLVYLFADPSDKVTAASAKTSGADLVDQKITFHIDITEPSTTDPGSHIKEFEFSQPTEQLLSLSLQSGLYSRYKIDKHFRNKEFERLYQAWIENSVNKKIADHTFVYAEEGRELGFVTLKIKEGKGQIGLIAVDESSRGKSIGKKLVATVINELYRRGIKELDVATQLDNEEACNFYRKVGFTGLKAENIYHIWL